MPHQSAYIVQMYYPQELRCKLDKINFSSSLQYILHITVIQSHHCSVKILLQDTSLLSSARSAEKPGPGVAEATAYDVIKMEIKNERVKPLF